MRMSGTDKSSTDFIREIINTDVTRNKHGGRVVTRFPPEPNGYLHIGHAKSICLNFGIAEEYEGARCHLRFDDTNPLKEEMEYIESIKEDVQWLGFDWGDHLYFASDYFEKLYEFAEQLVRKGLAYVDSLSVEQIREFRGTLTEPGKESPYRDRPMEENLTMFREMRAGKYSDGEHVLRAKIDMAHPNLNMRDPTIYRIRHATHPRTGDAWCIYPMYDFAHSLSDAIEEITHSLCTLEFEAHRPLYDWFVEHVDIKDPPQQIEFARLNLNYTVMSKRRLLRLVQEGHVDGWNDPRMPTISGLRRRGYTPESIRTFADRIGIAKSASVVDIALLEHCLREDLNARARRVMAVLKPLKLIIDNYPDDTVEWLEADNNPEDPGMGSRKVPFSKVLYIEQDDFKEDPPKKYFRLSPGKEIRLKHAYYITCVDYKKNSETGKIEEVHCTYDPKTKGGWSEDGRKVKGTSHWVSAPHAIEAEVRLYDHLFLTENPGEDKERDFSEEINPRSLEVLTGCKLEPGPAEATPGERFQFLRQGYFCLDSKHTKPGKPVFNRTVSLKDTWAKIKKKGQQ